MLTKDELDGFRKLVEEWPTERDDSPTAQARYAAYRLLQHLDEKGINTGDTALDEEIKDVRRQNQRLMDEVGMLHGQIESHGKYQRLPECPDVTITRIELAKWVLVQAQSWPTLAFAAGEFIRSQLALPKEPPCPLSKTS